MAGKKEYSMDFLLNARLNGAFSNTFSKAQQEFARLGKEIQSVNRLQSDISAYQKQQAAVENTAAKLQNLQKQHDLLQREIGETSGSTAALEREKLKLEQRISNTSAALENQKQKLDATGAKLKEAGVDTDNLAKKEAELAEKVKQLSAEQERAAEKAKDYGDTASSAFEAVSSAIAAAGVAEALKEIAEAYMDCIGMAGDFEAGMSNVKALSGATSAEMEQLSEKAKQLGADTKFSAHESAEAMGYMAMAGWNASEMLAGMDGVMALAAASGEDLAMVSDIVTDSMTVFGLTAADTARYADVLAAAATKSNTSVSFMGETFKFAAPVAGALGYSIEDVSVAVGLMANAGIKGSIAGTALKNTFNGLLEGATLTASAFGEYEYSAVKADGTMRSFSETIADLRFYFDQMTEAEKVANAETIAGMYGYSGLLAILNATNEDYDSLTNSINSCTGAAQRMAAVKMDNLNGDLELMNGSWEALKTTIGEQFIPEMRTLYSIGDDVFGAIDEFVQKNPAVVKGITATVGVIGSMAVGITGVAAAIKVATAASALLTATIPGVNVIMGVAAGVAAITGAVVGLTVAANEGVPSVKELTSAAKDMQDVMEDATAAYDETVSSTLAAANVADEYISKLEELEAAGINTEEETKQYHNTLALLCQVVPELANQIDLETNSIEGGTAALRANTEAWKQNALQQAYQTQLTSMYESYSAVLIEAEQNSIGLTKAQYELDAANQKLSDTQARMNELMEVAKAKAAEYNKQHWFDVEATAFLTQEYYTLQSSIYGINNEIRTAEKTVKNYNKAIEEDAEAVAAAEAEINLATEAIQNLTGATEENSEAAEEAARQQAELAGAVESVMSRVNALAESYEDAYNAAYESVSGQYKLWDEAADVVATSAYEINTALESQVSYWQDYNANLASLSERSKDIAGLSEVISSFADGSTESVNAIAGLANASDEELAAMVQNWKKLQEEQEAASGSIADLQTNFSETMDQLQADLAEDIEAMDLGTEAASSGQATIQGFIDGATSMLPQVEAAYGRLAAAAQAALSPTGGNATFSVPAYASGTRSAAPGFALVGEKGPELVYFDGGEQVVTAAETAALMHSNQPATISEPYQIAMLSPDVLTAMNAYAEMTAVQTRMTARPVEAAYDRAELSPPPQSNVQVVFQIDGNASPETVEALRDYGEEFAQRVIDVVEERVLDEMRRGYR